MGEVGARETFVRGNSSRVSKRRKQISPTTRKRSNKDLHSPTDVPRRGEVTGSMSKYPSWSSRCLKRSRNNIHTMSSTASRFDGAETHFTILRKPQRGNRRQTTCVICHNQTKTQKTPTRNQRPAGGGKRERARHCRQ